MKLLPADRRTGANIKGEDLSSVPREFITQKWFPRIRCNDCPGKVYNAEPGKAAENFGVHLKNRVHRERVDARLFGKKSG